MRTKYGKALVFAAAVLGIFLLSRLSGWQAFLTGEETLSLLTELSEEHLAAAILIYMTVTAVGCVVLTLPGIAFAVLAGFLFGPVLGTVCCAAAATLGAMASFLAGRYFLKDSIKPLVMKNRHLKKWLFDETGKNELFVLMITRLVPLFPYNLQNFAYGVTDISFGTYSCWSFVFMLPGTAVYTVGAAGLADRENRVLYLGTALFLAAAVAGGGFLFKRRYGGRVKERGNADGKS